MGRYRVIVVDPPWPVEGPARQVHPGFDGWGDQYEGTPIDWTPCPTPT